MNIWSSKTNVAKLDGYEDVMAWMDAMQKIPRKLLVPSVRAGARIAHNAARLGAPVKTGLLRSSIKMTQEKRKADKVVYDISIIESKINVKKGRMLVKYTKGSSSDVATKETTGNRSFYPASQEWGWTTASGKRVEPLKKRYMRNAIDHNRPAIANNIMKMMSDGLNQLGGKS
jgi:hypothetical protein